MSSVGNSRADLKLYVWIQFFQITCNWQNKSSNRDIVLSFIEVVGDGLECKVGQNGCGLIFLWGYTDEDFPCRFDMTEFESDVFFNPIEISINCGEIPAGTHN